MGYSTNYTLDVYKGNKAIYEILEEVGESFEGLNYAINENGECIDRVKWYDHEDDMRKISLEYMGIIFVLHGEGEENGDAWYKYFKNGKIQHCYAKITFDEYNENELR